MAIGLGVRIKYPDIEKCSLSSPPHSSCRDVCSSIVVVVVVVVVVIVVVVVVIHKIQTNRSTQIWYADDASSGGKLEPLKQWWDRLDKSGPYFGYFCNQKKSWLRAKPQFLESA